MIRIRIGSRWKAEAQRAPELAEKAHDSLGIEVDGIDISGGLLEDRLFPVTAALVEAVARLLQGAARTQAVPFAEGAIELLLARHGDAVSLSLVSLTRPARVLVRDLEVDLEALASAARASAQDLLGELSPEAAEAPAARKLSAACRRLALAVARPGAAPAAGRPASLRSRAPIGGTEAPSLGFDLRDEDGRLASYEGGEGLHALLAPGHLYLHGPDGEELCSVAGPPYLLLRDLADAALRMLEALRERTDTLYTFPLAHQGPEVEVDLRGNALTVAGRTLRCPPEALARAIFEGALDLGGVLLARNPELAGNPYLASLIEESRERVSLCEELAGWSRPEAEVPVRPEGRRPHVDGPPLATGRLRRVSLRGVWRTELPEIRSVHRAGDRAWVATSEEICALSLADGAVETRFAAGPRARVAVAGPKDPLLVLDEERLSARDAAGAMLWEIDTPDTLRIDGRWARVPREGGAAAGLLLDGVNLALLDLSDGRTLFRLDPPAAHRSAWASAARLLVLAADNGLLYGIDGAKGALAWRVRVDQPLLAVAIAAGRVVGIAEGREGLGLVGLEASTGTPVFRTELPVHEVGELIPMTGGVAVTGVGSAGGELLHVDATGAITWRARPILGPEAPLATRAGATIYARGSEGACRIDRGRVRWSVPCEAGGAPVLARGVIALPGERLEVLDAASGRDLLAPGATDGLGPADDLLATREGVLALLDVDGSCRGVRLAGALAVVG